MEQPLETANTEKGNTTNTEGTNNSEDVTGMEATAGVGPLSEWAHHLMPMPWDGENAIPSEPGAYAVVSYSTRYAMVHNTTSSGNSGIEEGLQMEDPAQAHQDSGLVQAYPVPHPIATATLQKRQEVEKRHLITKRMLVCLLISMLAGLVAIVSSSITISELFIGDPKRKEHQIIKQTIIDAFGEEYFDNSQKEKALHWLIYDDPRNDVLFVREHTPHQVNLVQRFSMAAIYFQTSVQQPWAYCNPPVGEQSQTCYYRQTQTNKEIMGTRWLARAPECQWMGVSCDARTRAVTEMQLYRNNMAGSIPAEEIAMLTSLTFLQLNVNNFTGALPTRLFDGGKLQSIFLNSNQLTCEIPPQAFLMPSLKELSLHSNQFKGSIASEVGYFKGIFLYLHGNLLTGDIPQQLYGATRLQRLALNDNMLTGTLSSAMSAWTDLTELAIGGNTIDGSIPSEIGLLQSLVQLEVLGSNLGGTIPEELYNCQLLQSLVLSGNQFSGTISTRVGQLKGLAHYEFANNKIRGKLPEELALLPQLVGLETNGNTNLRGSIPKELCSGRHQQLKIVADCTPSVSSGVPGVLCEERCCSICCDTQTNLCLEQ